jgi:hypothetical protein
MFLEILDIKMNNTISKLDILLTHLAINNDNISCGNHMGGNELQFVTIINSNNLIQFNEQSNISFDNDNFIWNSQWLIDSSIKDIRTELNIVFDNLPDETKSKSLKFIEQIKSNAFNDKHKILDPEQWNIKNMSLKDQLYFGAFVFQNFNDNLDLLVQFSEPIFLYLTRNFIKFDKMLDIYSLPTVSAKINTINNLVNNCS